VVRKDVPPNVRRQGLIAGSGLRQAGHFPLCSLISLKSLLDLMAGEPGFEPGLTESESAGLPLTYSPKSFRFESFGSTGDRRIFLRHMPQQSGNARFRRLVITAGK